MKKIICFLIGALITLVWIGLLDLYKKSKTSNSDENVMITEEDYECE